MISNIKKGQTIYYYRDIQEAVEKGVVENAEIIEDTIGAEILNEKNEKTVKRIHLLVTDLCSRNCPNCCNKCYSLNDVPVVTDEELRKAEWLFLTGGEPFEFTNPSAIAVHYKIKYPNIKKVIVYGNAAEFCKYPTVNKGKTSGIDGVSLSVKDEKDKFTWELIWKMIHDPDWDSKFSSLKYNVIYNFTGKILDSFSDWPVVERKWVNYKDWKPNPDSIFRKAF